MAIGSQKRCKARGYSPVSGRKQRGKTVKSPFRDIAAQCTVGQWTSGAAKAANRPSRDIAAQCTAGQRCEIMFGRLKDRRLVGTNRGVSALPLPRTDLSCGLCDRYAKSGVAVENSDADPDFRDLPIKVSCHQGLARQLDAVRPGLDTAPAAVSTPSSPDGPARISRSIHRLVSGDGSGAGGLPWPGVLAGRDDRMSTTGGNSFITISGITGPISRDAAERLVGWDLVRQLR